MNTSKLLFFSLFISIILSMTSCKHEIDGEPRCWFITLQMENGTIYNETMFTNDYHMDMQKEYWRKNGYTIIKCEKNYNYKTVEECRLQDTETRYCL